MTAVDAGVVVFVVATAILGYHKGLIASALSAGGIVVGAVIGARIAPHLLHEGTRSPYTPLAALAGAGVGAILLEALASGVGAAMRRGLRVPPLRMLDSLGGLAVGAVMGLALVWMLGATALLLPGQTVLRRSAERSYIVRKLNEILPPSHLLNALARIDPFPSINGPAAPVLAPDPRLLLQPQVRAAKSSVVRVLGTACGLAVSGSGWVVRPGFVVTAAHVVAGETDTVVERADSNEQLPATPVAFDVRNDIAVLRVPALTGARPLPLADPRPGANVAILGFPENGPFAATPGRVGTTAIVLSQDAYGNGPVSRIITSLRGLVRHGNSGGPAVDGRGDVESTIFAARVGSRAGYGIPAEIIHSDLGHTGESAVSTGACAAG